MKRRQFFKMVGRTGLGLILSRTVPTPKQSEDQADFASGVDVATEEADRSVASVHSVDGLGGYLVPQGYQDQIIQAMTQGAARGNSSYVTRSVARWDSLPILNPTPIISQERDLTVLMEALNREKNNTPSFFPAIRDGSRRSPATSLYWNT